MIIKEKNYLKEGPGAGYTISVGDYEVKSIDNVVIDSIEPAGNNYFSGITIKGKCLGKVVANEVEAESYYYGTVELNDIPAEFTWFEYDFDGDECDRDELILNDNVVKERIFKDYSEDYDSAEDVDYYEFSLEEIFKYLTVEDIDPIIVKKCLDIAISGSSSSINYGGGYVHSTYDGQLTETDDISFDNSNITCDMYITDKEVIDYIDKAVSGDNQYTTYDIQIGNEVIESYATDEYSLDDVIEEAKKYAEEEDINISNISIKRTYWTDYFNGDSDIDEWETVWEGSEEN